MNTPPQTATLVPSAYQILDIRTPDLGEVKLQVSNKDTDVTPIEEQDDGNSKNPPTPPISADQSVDAFNSADLVDVILDSLNRPLHQKAIPTFVLYDKRGLRIFDEITHLDEYYLTNAEMRILENRADQIATRLNHGSVLIELGAGYVHPIHVL